MLNNTPVVIRLNNKGWRMADRLNIPSDQFQEICTQLVEYIGESDDLDNFLRIAMRKAENNFDEILKEQVDEGAAQLARRLYEIMQAYKSPEWLVVQDGEWEIPLNSHWIASIEKVKVTNRVLIHMVGRAPESYYEFTFEQWENRRVASAIEVLSAKAVA